MTREEKLLKTIANAKENIEYWKKQSSLSNEELLYWLKKQNKAYQELKSIKNGKSNNGN